MGEFERPVKGTFTVKNESLDEQDIEDENEDDNKDGNKDDNEDDNEDESNMTEEAAFIAEKPSSDDDDSIGEWISASQS